MNTYKIDYLDKHDRIRHKYIEAIDYNDARRICNEWLKKRTDKKIETHEILGIYKKDLQLRKETK